MKDQDELIYELLKLVLPPELFTYFDIVQLLTNEKSIDVHLEEKHQYPDGYADHKLISKGFSSSVTVQDFPIRERAVYLHVKRRRWQVPATGEYVSRDWAAVAKGTRYTEGFASFLKGLFGQLPGQ